jgi:putative membrane protein
VDRRQFAGVVLGAAVVGLVAPAAAFAQDGNMPDGAAPLGPDEQRYVLNTLGVGGVALAASQMAQQRAQSPWVRQFADFEVAEQTAVAQVLNEASGVAPPPPNPRDREMLDRLADIRGPGFDRDYVMGQIDGHRRLLTVQERLLASGGTGDPSMRWVATMARTQINEHLRLLEGLRQQLG